MSNPHPSRNAISAGTAARQRQQREEREYRFTEADFLLSCGTAPDIARQLGCTVGALIRQAERWGRLDLARRLTSYERGQCVDCDEPIHPRSTRCIGCHNRYHIPARRFERTAA